MLWRLWSSLPPPGVRAFFQEFPRCVYALGVNLPPEKYYTQALRNLYNVALLDRIASPLTVTQNCKLEVFVPPEGAGGEGSVLFMELF
jgi:hypothetical protein